MNAFLTTLLVGISLSMDAFSLALIYGTNNLSKKDIFKEFARKFNESFDFYIAGKQIYSLDLSKEFDEYLKDELGEDYPNE